MATFLYSCVVTLEQNEEAPVKFSDNNKYFIMNPHGLGQFEDIIQMIKRVFVELKKEDSKFLFSSLQAELVLTNISTPEKAKETPTKFTIPYQVLKEGGFEQNSETFLQLVSEKIHTLF